MANTCCASSSCMNIEAHLGKGRPTELHYIVMSHNPPPPQSLAFVAAALSSAASMADLLGFLCRCWQHNPSSCVCGGPHLDLNHAQIFMNPKPLKPVS